MRDQVRALSLRCGEHASCYLGSQQRDPGVEHAAADGQYKIVYVTPEKLNSWEASLARLHGMGKLLLVAVDKAHCVSEWGHDFRPSYRNIWAPRDSLPGLPFVALAATATVRVQADIIKNLGLGNAVVSKTSFRRENSQTQVSLKTTRDADLRSIARELRARPEATIVRVVTRKEVDALGELLRELLGSQLLVVRYHARGKTPSWQTSYQRWSNGEHVESVATRRKL